MVSMEQIANMGRKWPWLPFITESSASSRWRVSRLEIHLSTFAKSSHWATKMTRNTQKLHFWLLKNSFSQWDHVIRHYNLFTTCDVTIFVYILWRYYFSCLHFFLQKLQQFLYSILDCWHALKNLKFSHSYIPQNCETFVWFWGRFWSLEHTIVWQLPTVYTYCLLPKTSFMHYGHIAQFSESSLTTSQFVV